MNKEIYEFWKNNSLDNIKPNRGNSEFPEGWDVVEFFKNLYPEEEYGHIIEIGCGYGRLCKAFNKNNYSGVDVSPNAISRAKQLNPEYNFALIDNTIDYWTSHTKLLYTVLLHISDEDIDYIIESLCNSTYRIIIAEVMDRKVRRPGNPPVFNRYRSDYIELFTKYGKEVVDWISNPYKAYEKENYKLDILVFE